MTITMAVVISTALSQYSFKKSFLEYVEQQEQRKLENLGNSLLAQYQESTDWEFIRGKKRVWLFYLRLKPEKLQADFFQNNERFLRRARRQEQYALRQERKLLRAMPKKENYKKQHNKRNSFALLDKNKKNIVGVDLPHDNTQYHPLSYDGEIVAYIQHKKFTGITDQLDKIFANKQEQAFLFNTLSTLLISIIAALFVSIYFRKRINVLTKIAHELTSGQYQNRVIIKQKDELGQLGMDFNILAKTLQKNQQSQQHWIADVSHELRTPIAILKGELQALDDGIRPLDESAVHSLKQETERLSKLVEDLYQLSVSDMGALKYDKKYFDINELLEEIEANYVQSFEQKKLSLFFEYNDSQACLFNGDKQRFYQLISNLLKNSLRYTNADGQVLIACQCSSDKIRLSISDSSPGVEPEKLPKIFDRLFRVESSRTRTNGGAGLGLAIVKQIVLAHHGRISVEPSKLGGIMITMDFPK